MSERKYTVDEVSDLRRVLENSYLFGRYSGPSGGSGTSRTYHESDMRIFVEELTRTHMLAGHTAADLLATEAPGLATTI